MLKIYTTDEVKEAMLATGKQWFPMRNCSVCGECVGYIVQECALYFNSACGCGGWDSPTDPRNWDDVAILINNNPDNTELKSVFGLIEKGD